MTEGSAPAGWYPDGQGRDRWWDGSQWTDTFAHEDSSELSVKASDELGRRLEVKSLGEGVATLSGTTLTFRFGRGAGAKKRASSPVSVDILRAHELQAIEPGKFRPGLLRVVMDPDEHDVPYSSDPYSFIFASGRRIKEVKAFLGAVGEVSPSGLAVAAKSVMASVRVEMGDALREAGDAMREASPDLNEAVGGIYEGLVAIGEAARRLEGIDGGYDSEDDSLDDDDDY